MHEIESLKTERDFANKSGMHQLRDKKQEELDRHIDERRELINELYKIKDRYDNLWYTSNQTEK